ncbi:MAG: GIY-YIG nuclease family protein [Selenomonadaceae bacterium]|nr:GIY-YIG nuclease family protein [Selenomonadaceae bacterium]
MAYGRIYGIECLVDGNKIYVGQTTRDVRLRIMEHKSDKRQHMWQIIRKFGWENFVWVVLEECDSQEELDEAERRWIKRLNCVYPNGYNRGSGGKRGFKCHELTRKEMSTVQLGRIIPNSNRLKVSAAKRKVFYPNIVAELDRQQLTYTALAKLLNVNCGTLMGKLNGNNRLDEKTALAIKEILGVDIPLEELFKTVEGNAGLRVEKKRK